MVHLTGNVYTVRDVAKRLRLAPLTVQWRCKQGALKGSKDFFILPSSGKRSMVRLTQAQYDRLVQTSPTVCGPSPFSMIQESKGMIHT
jgi:hypothetical protein